MQEKGFDTERAERAESTEKADGEERCGVPPQAPEGRQKVAHG
jgi:hypothetical protein